MFSVFEVFISHFNLEIEILDPPELKHSLLLLKLLLLSQPQRDARPRRELILRHICNNLIHRNK